MKFFSVSFLFTVFFLALAFAEHSDDSDDISNIDTGAKENVPPPLPRITCDLLSFGGKVGHAACAAHCLLKGYRGGYCDSKGVCNCRK